MGLHFIKRKISDRYDYRVFLALSVDENRLKDALLTKEGLGANGLTGKDSNSILYKKTYSTGVDIFGDMSMG